MVEDIGNLDAGISSYLFGSYVNNGGSQFDPQTGDIDLVHALAENSDCIQRAELLFSLREVLDKLEISLMRALVRKDFGAPIASHCVLTPLERQYDIHKDQKKSLLSGERFALLPNDSLNTADLIALSQACDVELEDKNYEAIQSLAFAQSIRNRFLSSSPNGSRAMLALQPGQSKDPLPKEYMRVAAMLAWSSGNRKSVVEREDTQRGLDFISSELLPPLSKSNHRYFELSEALSVWRGARGKAQSLMPEHQVLIAEMLFDHAAASLDRTFKMKLSDFVSGLNDKMQRPSDPKA